jgi:hypothetical protein
MVHAEMLDLAVGGPPQKLLGPLDLLHFNGKRESRVSRKKVFGNHR